MTYLEYVSVFNKYNEFNVLVSEQSKLIDFSNKECQEALQKWIFTWSEKRFTQLQELFKTRTGPKTDLVFINQVLKDSDFMRTYLETFGVTFLNLYCGYEKSLVKVKTFIQNKQLIEYSTEYNNSDMKVWKFNQKEIKAVELNDLLKDQVKLDPIYIPFLTLIWSQTKIKNMIISAYIQSV
jgi:hypothetical protein